jgi:hypothetical protein
MHPLERRTLWEGERIIGKLSSWRGCIQRRGGTNLHPGDQQGRGKEGVKEGRSQLSEMLRSTAEVKSKDAGLKVTGVDGRLNYMNNVESTIVG